MTDKQFRQAQELKEATNILSKCLKMFIDFAPREQSRADFLQSVFLYLEKDGSKYSEEFCAQLLFIIKEYLQKKREENQRHFDKL